MNIRKGWALLGLVCIVLYAGILFFSQSAANTSDLLRPSEMKTGLQNFSLAYDSSTGLTFVGTYKNRLIAFDGQGKKVWEFQTNGPVREMKVDEKNRKLYAGCEDRNLYILDIDSGKQSGLIKVQRRIYSIDINRDGSLIAVSAGINAFKHDLLVYDGQGKNLFTKAIGSISLSVTFNKDYSSIILGTNRAEILVYDLKGNQTAKKKLNYEIVGIEAAGTEGRLAVLTRNTTCYIMDEKLNVLSSSVYYGEGMSISASPDLKWIGIGNKEGNFYTIDNKGTLLYTKKLGDSITGILFTDKKIIVTGLGDFIYELQSSQLQNISLMSSLSTVLGILVFAFPVVLLFILIMSVNALRNVAGRFFKALYKYRIAYIMLIPTFGLMIVFNYFPVIIAFIRSFTDWNIHQSSIREIQFIGVDNFVKMFTEGYFLTGMQNLLILLITSFIKVITVPLLVAELVFLMQSDRMKYWFRFLFVLPMVVPGIVMALMWNRIYDPGIGLLNNLLGAVGLQTLQHSWLGDPQTAIWAIVFMGFPFINAFAFLVYYGGLIDIPSSLFEAARADGSNGWWNFTRIHLPLVTPQIKMLIILTFIGTVQDFSNIFVLTSGGPGSSTYVPGLELYYNATRFGQYGYACALGVIMFVAILGGTVLNMKMRVNSEYND